MTEEKPAAENGCACDCDCECCKQCCEGCQKEKSKSKNKLPDAISQIHVNDTVGATFLGTLAVLLLIFLVRSNKRNRELLLEVIELRRQA